MSPHRDEQFAAERYADLIRKRLMQFAGSEAYKHAEDRQGNALEALDGLLSLAAPNRSAAEVLRCPECGDPLELGHDCLAGDYDDRDEYDCSWCGGEGEFWGDELPGYDPGWHLPDHLYPCPACHGTGNRRDQVLF